MNSYILDFGEAALSSLFVFVVTTYFMADTDKRFLSRLKIDK